MNTRSWARALRALGLCGLVGCGSDSQDGQGSGGVAAAGGTQTTGGAAAANGGAPSGGAGGAPSAGGGPAAGGALSSGSAPSSGGAVSSGGTASSGGTTVSSGGATSSSGGTVSSGGNSSGGMSASGGGGAIPTPVSAPQIWGFGIGITDVPGAVKFYTEVMKMTVEKEAVKREDRTETVLYGTQAARGARVVLMKFDDARNTKKITAKLVFQSQSAAAINRAASSYPDYVSRLNFGIVQFDGPDTYIHEVGGVFDSGGSAISVPYPIAVGFAVSDQPASRKFYTALGMTESSIGSFSVTDATGTGNIAEYSVKFSQGTGAVLQKWTPARNAKDNPIKVVVSVPDAKAMADKVVAAGGAIVKPAERTPAYDNRLLVVAKDPDGYVLEIVE